MINGKIIYSHVSIVLKILYFRQISDGKQIIFIIFTPFIISNHCLQHVLLVQFHLRHSNGVKCLKLGSADIELWRSERKTTRSGRSFPIRISTSSCQDDNNLKQKWLLLILPRKS